MTFLERHGLKSPDIAPGGEFQRVAALARREPMTDAEIDALSDFLRKRSTCCDDAECRVCGGSGQVRLLRDQAEALKELFELRGLFGAMGCGTGKTLITFLAPVLLGAQRPVLLVPADLRSKTLDDFRAYSQAWHCRLPTIISYQALGLPQHAEALEKAAPDLLILDEAHYTRNLFGAACAIRVNRYLEGHPDTIVAPLSGTLITSKLTDYQHHAVWALGEAAPCPIERTEAERWGQAVDREVSTLRRVRMATELPGGFHEWFRGSRGIISVASGDCSASIQIDRWRPKLSDELRETISRTAVSSMRPDGELLDERELPDCLCRLALGHYRIWDPMPPDWWLHPRRGWYAYVQAIRDERLPGFDSQAQVEAGVEAGTAPYPADGRALLDAWRAVEKEFEPNPVAVWLDEDPLRQAVEAAGDDCLIWTRYRDVGGRIGVPYFGEGTNAANGRGTIAVSVRAQGTGKNLQHKWHRNLVLTPLASASLWEQLISRTHRRGQKADTVYVTTIDAIPYHRDVMSRVRAEARATQRASGSIQKLCVADWAA